MLGNVDFSVVEDFKPVPANRYAGQTGTWELKDANDSKSQNVVVKYPFEYEDEEGNSKTRTHTQYYNLKPQALWRLKRDLIALGNDPALLSGKDVDLEAVLNETFGSIPKAVWLHFTVEDMKKAGQPMYEDDGVTVRKSNALDKVELRTA